MGRSVLGPRWERAERWKIPTAFPTALKALGNGNAPFLLPPVTPLLPFLPRQSQTRLKLWENSQS